MIESVEDLKVVESLAQAQAEPIQNQAYNLDVLGQRWTAEFHHYWGGQRPTSLCVLRHVDPFIPFAGVAICAPYDRLDWQIGYKLAFKRAVEQAALMYGTELPLKILDAAFRYELWKARVNAE